MKELFEKISNEENCEYKVIYEKSYAPYVHMPFVMRENGLQIKSLILDVPYKNNLIRIKYELGKDQKGKLYSQLGKTGERLDFPVFRITNRSHYLRLFNKRLNVLKIDCQEDDFKKDLRNKLDELELEQIARNVLFEPEIKGEQVNNKYELKTSFYLAFAEKKKVLRPLIDFYKYLIDQADFYREGKNKNGS